MMGATATPDEFEPFRFSSEKLRPADRIPFYRDLMDRVTVRMDFESLDERFVCKAQGYRLSDLSMYYVAGSAVRAGWRGWATEGGLALVMNLEGTTAISQRGREVGISAGNSSLHSSTDPMRMERTASRIAI